MSEDTYEVLSTLNEQTKLLRTISQQLDQLIKKEHAGSAYQWTPEGLPICPKHGEAMSRREKQGDVWYSHAITDPASGEVTYCKGYAGKSSPGWAVENGQPRPDTPQDYLEPVDLQRTGSAGEPLIPDGEAAQPAAPPSAGPANGPAKDEFYRLGKEAIAARTIEPQAFNTLAAQGSQGGWENALAELNEALVQK